MCKLLLEAEPILVGAGIGVDKQDRLGRTVLHIAAQYNMKKLTQTLLAKKEEGGFGADPLVSDLVCQRPIHYAIAFKSEQCFDAHLDHYQAHSGSTGGLSESPVLRQLNSSTVPYTLASYCVVKSSWRCFSKLIERVGLSQLHVKVELKGFDRSTMEKTPRVYARECNSSN